MKESGESKQQKDRGKTGRRKWILPVVILVAALTGLAVFRNQGNGESAASVQGGTGGGKDGGTAVRTIIAVTEVMEDRIFLNGTLLANESVEIRPPVLTLVFASVIVLFGYLGFQQLGIREFPAVERPVISVSTSYPGANAAVVENQITEPLEEEINTVAGITSMSSISREGRSTITVEFDIGFDLDIAANDVRDRASAAIRRLPDDADPPVIEKADADGDPIVFLNVSSDRRDLLELSEIADRLFKTRFQTIEGVAKVDIWGDKQYAMRLWLDPTKLAAHQLTVLDVRNALRAANVELPSGLVEGEFVELSVRTLSRLGADPEEFNNIVLRQDGDRSVQLRDVGRAEIGPLNLRTVLKRDGVPMVGVVLRPQTGANEIEIVDEFYRRLAQIEAELPEDVKTAVGFDTSVFIRNSIAEVKQTIFIALALVCLTIFLFLREWRSSVIPLLTIPIALTGTFFIMYLAGFTINILTLLGMVLAIGLVVDDAVVVLENVYTKIEGGLEPLQAGIEGIREIFLAVVATTLALVAVFLPIVFLGGLTGILFREFGITLASAVVISSLVALTLTPMLCSKLLKKRDRHPWFHRVTEPFFERLNSGYKASLGVVMRHRWIVLVMFAVCGTAIVLLFNGLQRELAPLEDRSLLVLRAVGPQGANFEYMTGVVNEMDQIVAEVAPEVKAVISVTSPGFGGGSTVNSGFARVTLPTPEARERTQSEIANTITARMRDFPPAQIYVTQRPTIQVGRSRGFPVQFVLQNPNFDRLAERLPEFLDAARSRPEFSAVTVDLEFDRPELELDIDRDRANNLGISAADVAETVQASLSGQRFGFFLKDGRQYEIIAQLDRDQRSSPLDLTRISLRGNDGRLVPLENVVQISETTSPAVLYRTNRFTSATVSANPADGFTLGDGIAAMREIAGEVLDDTFTTELAGESQEFERAGGSLLFVFVLALVLVFMVLAAQFESFRDPMIILLTVPLALAGGLSALGIFGLSLNIFSQIGLIMLIGLVTKNGILLVEFANQRREAGLNRLDAVMDAAAARFRPILMTAISTILGTLPIALSLGAGAQSRIPLGVAVIGGMLLGTFLTLYVVPAAYSVLSPKHHAKRGV